MVRGGEAEAQVHHEAEALGAEAGVAGGDFGVETRGGEGGFVVELVAGAPGEGAAVHLGADKLVLDDVAGVDGEAGREGAVELGREEAIRLEPEVAEFVGEEHDGIVGAARKLFEVEEDEGAERVAAAQAERESLSAGEGLLEGRIGEVRFEEKLLLGAEARARYFDDADGGGDLGFDIALPGFDGGRKLELPGEEERHPGPEGHNEWSAFPPGFSSWFGRWRGELGILFHQYQKSF